MSNNLYDDPTVTYGPGGPLPPIANMRGVPRPPASIPRVASRAPLVPMPKASPPHAGDMKPEAVPLAAKPAPEPAQQSAAVQTKPADAPSHPPAAVPIVEAKPAPEIRPTQEMPKGAGAGVSDSPHPEGHRQRVARMRTHSKKIRPGLPRRFCVDRKINHVTRRPF